MTPLNLYINETFMPDENRNRAAVCSMFVLQQTNSEYLEEGQKAEHCTEINLNLMHTLQSCYIQLGRVTEVSHDAVDTVHPRSDWEEEYYSGAIKMHQNGISALLMSV